MARETKTLASDDIWHLSIEDLLSPPAEATKSCGEGPFVINLRTSSCTISLPPKGLMRIDHVHVYQLRRSDDGGGPQFLLRLGIIDSELEADAILESVREHYPRAVKEAAAADDEAALAIAQAAMKPASLVSAQSDANVADVKTLTTVRPAARPQAVANTTEAFQWDIDEVLPHLARTDPTAPKPPPSKRILSEGLHKVTPLSAAPPRTAAARRPADPLSAPRSDPAARPESALLASTRLATQTAPPALDIGQVVTHPPSPAMAPSAASRRDEALPRTTIESIDSDPNAVTDEVAVLRSPERGPIDESERDSASLESLVTRIGALVESVESHHKDAPPSQGDAHPHIAPLPSVSSSELVNCVASHPDSVPESSLPPEHKSAPRRAGAPWMDSTQTMRALTPLELAENEASRWYVIQLALSVTPIDPEQVPNLDIFQEYRLYSVTGLDNEQIMHALRVGFFSSDIAAEAVSHYLGAFFDAPSVKRVSIAERERFAERRLAARKNVGETGAYPVIELAGPAPLPERRADLTLTDSGKRPALEVSSLWSRLLSPLNR